MHCSLCCAPLPLATRSGPAAACNSVGALTFHLSLCPVGVDQGTQFAVADVEVVTATVDLDEVVSYRGAVSSLQEQASSAPRVPTIAVDFNLCCPDETGVIPNGPIEPRYHVPEEEIALGEGCWTDSNFPTEHYTALYLFRAITQVDVPERDC